MTEEEKQELELLRQEKHQRTQTERACLLLADAGIADTFAPLLIGADDEDTDRRTQQFCSAYQTVLADNIRQRLPQQAPTITVPTSHRSPRGIHRIH